MADVFFSYSRTERSRIVPIVDALQSLNLSTWFDKEIPPGKNYQDVINEELELAKAVVVCWSSKSKRSTWVKSEATFANERSTIVPCYLDQCALMPPFNTIQTADLSSWNGDIKHEEWRRLVASIGTLVGRPGLLELLDALQDKTWSSLSQWAAKYPSDPSAKASGNAWAAQQQDQFDKEFFLAGQRLDRAKKRQQAQIDRKLAGMADEFTAWLALGPAAHPEKRPDPKKLLSPALGASGDDYEATVARLAEVGLAADAAAKEREALRLSHDNLSRHAASLSEELAAAKDGLTAAQSEINELTNAVTAYQSAPSAHSPPRKSHLRLAAALGVGLVFGGGAFGVAVQDPGVAASVIPSGMNAAIQPLRDQVAALTKQLMDAQNDRDGKAASLSAMSADLAKARADAQAAKADLAKAKTDLEAANRNASQAKGDGQTAATQLRQLSAQISDLQQKQLDANSRANQLQAALDDANRNLTQARSDAQSASNEASSYMRQLSDLRQTMSSLSSAAAKPVAVAAIPSTPAPTLRTPAKFNCSAPSFGSDYVICASAVLMDAEARAEEAYEAIRQGLSAKGRQELLNNQREWWNDYGPNCGLPLKGRPSDSLLRSSKTQQCILAALESRIKELRNW